MSNSSDAREFARRVALRLKTRREELGMSKLAVAQHAGLDQRTITFIEEGVNVPSLTTLFSICTALQSDVNEMVEDYPKSIKRKRSPILNREAKQGKVKQSRSRD